MISNNEVLGEVLFSDHRSGILTSRIGIIDISEIQDLENNSKLFIMFKECYHPPIYKPDIKEIIIYPQKGQFNIKENDLWPSGLLKIKISAKIS